MRGRRVARWMLVGAMICLAAGVARGAWATPRHDESPASAGATYYVAPNGDDDAPGSAAQPWRTIQHAAETMTAGDTAYIRAGTYREQVTPRHSGSAGAYITYAAYPGDAVTMDGASVKIPEWEGLFNIVEQGYIRVAGLRVINAGPGPHNPGILADTAHHIIIENNTVYHTSDSGIGVWASSEVVVDHNEGEEACYAGYNEAISVGGTDGFEVSYNHVHHTIKEGIDAKDGSSNGKVFGNHVHHTEAVGIYTDAWDKHTHDIAVYGNVVHDSPENGFAAASEQGGLLENISFYNNIAYNNGWVGLHVTACCIATHPMANIQIINNTFYGNGWDPWGGGILLENPQAEGVVIRNNICSQNLYFQLAVSANVPADHYTVDHNLINGFRGAEDEIYGDNYVAGDPLFVSAAEADFRLRPGSPAIDQGSPSGAPASDFEGQARPFGAGYDIGADEYAAGAYRAYLPVIEGR